MSGSPTNPTSRSDWERVQREYRSGKPPAYDEDAPDFSELMRADLERRRCGRVAGSGKKSSQTIRLDFDILAAFKATGKGWQTRMNDALRTYLQEHPLDKAA